MGANFIDSSDKAVTQKLAEQAEACGKGTIDLWRKQIELCGDWCIGVCVNRCVV